MAADAQKVAEKVAQLSNAVRVDDKGGASEELSASLPIVVKAIEEALAKNGYGVEPVLKLNKKPSMSLTEKSPSPPHWKSLGFETNTYCL